jgi:hypothetical protein
MGSSGFEDFGSGSVNTSHGLDTICTASTTIKVFPTLPGWRGEYNAGAILFNCVAQEICAAESAVDCLARGHSDHEQRKKELMVISKRYPMRCLSTISGKDHGSSIK